jgi:putative transposase
VQVASHFTIAFSQTGLRHQWLMGKIRRVFDENKDRYGSPHIAQQLYEKGHRNQQKTVAILMQLAGLLSIYSRKRR